MKKRYIVKVVGLDNPIIIVNAETHGYESGRLNFLNSEKTIGVGTGIRFVIVASFPAQISCFVIDEDNKANN